MVAVNLYSNISNLESKCAKYISDTLGCILCVSFFKLHFDVSCDLLLNRNLAKVNAFVNVT